MKKTLHLITALALTLVFALTACTKKPDDTPTTQTVDHDERVQTVYEAVKLTSASTDKSFEDWLNDWVKSNSDGKNTTSVTTTADGDLTLHFDDEQTKTVEMPKIFTVHTLDQNDNPVVGAHVRVCYDDADYITHTAISDFSSNSEGIARTAFIPVSGRDYYAKSADIDNPDPNGYVCSDFPIFESDDMNEKTNNLRKNYSFNDARTATLRYNNLSVTNEYFASNKVYIPYSRIYSATETQLDENNKTQSIYRSNDFFSQESYATGDENVTASDWASDEGGKVSSAKLTVDYTGGRVKYFKFRPHVAARTNGAGAETDTRIKNAATAATGIYRITLSGGDARLYLFNQITVYSQVDENGIPKEEYVQKISGSAPAGANNAEKYTGQNYIDINVCRTDKEGEFYGFENSTEAFELYLTGSENATVTITVTRLCDSVNSVIREEQVSAAVTPAPQSGWGTGTETLMPIKGSKTVVYNETDGFYHVDSADGAILLIQLKKRVSRFADNPIIDIPKNAQNGSAAFCFTTSQKSEVPVPNVGNVEKTIYTRLNYNAMISAYSAAAGDDGLYGVTKPMADFLKKYGGGFSAAEGEYAWLAPCFYYA